MDQPQALQARRDQSFGCLVDVLLSASNGLAEIGVAQKTMSDLLARRLRPEPHRTTCSPWSAWDWIASRETGSPQLDSLPAADAGLSDPVGRCRSGVGRFDAFDGADPIDGSVERGDAVDA